MSYGNDRNIAAGANVSLLNENEHRIMELFYERYGG